MRETDDFDAFYALTVDRLIGQVFAMTGDLGEAEDAVQEAYIRAWQRWAQVGGYDNPEAWLRTVAYRIAVNSWRKARNRLSAHHRAGWRRDQPGPSPDGLALVSALQKIPKAQRQAIVLYHVADLSIDEIAVEVGVPVGTVKARLARGRRALAPLVSDFDDEPGHGARAGRPPRTTHGREPARGSASAVGPDLEFHDTRPDWESTNHA
jgi:RNA polymerase sigma-70 factor, ECF subfamily